MSKRTYNGVNFNGKHYNSWTETDDKGNSVTTIYGPEINNTKDNTQISNRDYIKPGVDYDSKGFKKFLLIDKLSIMIGGIGGILALIGLCYLILKFMEFVVNM